MQKITIICSDQDEAQEYWYSHKTVSTKYPDVRFQTFVKTPVLWPNRFNIIFGVSYKEIAEMEILRIEKEHSLVLGSSFSPQEIKNLNLAGWNKIEGMSKKLYLNILERHLKSVQKIPSDIVINRVSKQLGLTKKEKMIFEFLLLDKEVSEEQFQADLPLETRSQRQHLLGLKKKLASIGISLTDNQNRQFYRIS